MQVKGYGHTIDLGYVRIDEEDSYEVADEELYTYDEDVYEDFDVPEKSDDHPQDVGCTSSASTQLAQLVSWCTYMYITRDRERVERVWKVHGHWLCNCTIYMMTMLNSVIAGG